MEEKTSLLGNATEPKSFYFINKGDRTKSVAKEGGDIEIRNSAASTPRKQKSLEGGSSRAETKGEESQFQWVSSLLSSFNRRSSGGAYQSVADQPKPRKVPVKIEPKVFFANERTFLAWLHMAVTLASISVAILAFAEANEWSQLYGMMLMPVAIAFCVYALSMFIKRGAMIRRKDPGPYEDRAGPIALSVLLAIAIMVNFFVKLYDYTR